MTESEIKQVVAEAVAETLIKLGIDVSEPVEVQKDFQHMRSWRKSVEAVQRQGLLTTTIVFVTGVAGLVWLAVTKGPG